MLLRTSNGKHPLDSLLVRFGDDGGLAQLALSGTRLLGQQMPAIGLAPFEFTAGSLLESLCRRAVAFHFGHLKFPLWSKQKTPILFFDKNRFSLKP
jgi:hypothetical protein